MSLDAASRSTRIRPRYLAALEDDAGVDAFPGPVYERFFLQEYARYLGVDDAPLVQALKERTPPEPSPLRAVAELEPPRRWVNGLIRLAAVGALLALIAYSLIGSSNGRTHPPGMAAIRERLMQPAEYVHRPRASVGTPNPDIPIRTVVVVRTPTFVSVFADGERVIKRNVLQPRRLVIRSFGTRAHPQASVDVEVADGSAVKLVVNGRIIPTQGRAPFHARFVSFEGRLVRL